MEITDVVHGSFDLPPLVAAIVQTDIFQRLKEIHQLGCLYFITPEATSNRYEHCLGTYYVADQMLNCLEANTDSLAIPLFYRRCVTVAGLLHDVGHGPFSHCWEAINKSQTHEKNAYDCIDEIFLRGGIKLDDNDDLHLLAIDTIKSLINPVDGELKKKVIEHRLFDPEYMFIYEIISNKKCELDVDKVDYLLRDKHYLHSCEFFPKNSDTMEKYEVRGNDIINIFYNARVSKDRQHIEYKYADFGKIYHLFDARSQFHMAMYQNTDALFVEKLLAELVLGRDSMNSTHKLAEVDSTNIKDFLDLKDSNVLSEFERLQDPTLLKKWRAMRNLSFSEVIEKSLGCYEINVNVEYAGTKMKEDDIPFYGDPNEKTQLEQRRGTFKKTSYYVLNDNNNNDHN